MLTFEGCFFQYFHSIQTPGIFSLIFADQKHLKIIIKINKKVVKISKRTLRNHVFATHASVSGKNSIAMFAETLFRINEA